MYVFAQFLIAAEYLSNNKNGTLSFLKAKTPSMKDRIMIQVTQKHRSNTSILRPAVLEGLQKPMQNLQQTY